MKIVFWFCLGLLCMAACSEVAVRPAGSEGQVVAISPSVDACLPREEIARKLHAMANATSQLEANQVREVLLNEARRSDSCRSSLIESVVKTMGESKSAVEERGADFNVWRNGAGLLADLNASEALDFLIAHLDVSSGLFSTSMSHMPALNAVIKIGDNALPKLSQVLQHHTDASMRMYSVYCISSIGGPSATAALKAALPSESDRCVKGFIQASIEALDNEQQHLLDNSKWFSAFMCAS